VGVNTTKFKFALIDLVRLHARGPGEGIPRRQHLLALPEVRDQRLRLPSLHRLERPRLLLQLVGAHAQHCLNLSKFL
jgi:hypothetical protein